MKEYLEEQMSHIKEIIKEFNEMLSIHQEQPGEERVFIGRLMENVLLRMASIYIME